MQSIHHVFRIMLDNIWVCQDRHPVSVWSLWRLDAVHTETSWQASDTSKDGLERFTLMMRNVVFEYWLMLVSFSHDAMNSYPEHLPWIMLTQLSVLFAIFVSPHRPEMSGSLTQHEIRRDNASGYNFVSASTMRQIS